MARTLASIAVVPVISLVMVLTSLATVAIASSPNYAMPADGHEMEHVADH